MGARRSLGMRKSCENYARTMRKLCAIFRQTDRQTQKGMANWALDEVWLCENYAKTMRNRNLKENLYAPQSCLGPSDSGPRGTCLDPRGTCTICLCENYAKPMRKLEFAVAAWFWLDLFYLVLTGFDKRQQLPM